MAVGGALRAGDSVDVSATTPSGAMLFQNLLVLYVRAETDARSGERPFTVVVALPMDRRQEFATAIGGGSLVITRALVGAGH
jgi:hypothetical protein